MLLIGYIMLTRLDFSLAVKQFLFATVGLIVTSFVPYIMQNWKNLRVFGKRYGLLGLIGLMTVFIPGIGFENYGSRNWIHIGSFSLQPMEFVKILFVFFVASMLCKASTFGELLANAIISAAFMGVLVLEKDLGAAVIFYITYVCLVYLATSRPIFLVGGIGIGVGAVYAAYLLFKDSLFAHVMVRVSAWRNPFADIDGGGYQLSQSLFAIGTGGYLGSGLTQGSADIIPVSESDFIFSAICEELGVIFGLALILVIVSIFISFVNVAMQCRDPFYKYVRIRVFGDLYHTDPAELRRRDKVHPFHGCDAPADQLRCIIRAQYPDDILHGTGGLCISTKEAIKIERDKEQAREAILERRIATHARGEASWPGKLKEKRITVKNNVPIMVITYLMTAVFMAMIGYVIYFMQFQAETYHRKLQECATGFLR